MSGVWTAGAIVGSAVIGGLFSNSAAKKQEKLTKKSLKEQSRQFDLQRADRAPWLEAGRIALGQLTAGTVNGGEFNRDYTAEDFKADPGYEFRRREGLRGVEAGASARGGVLSGGTLKAVEQYGQDVASGEFTNAYNRFNNDRTQRFNRLSAIAGTGQQQLNELGRDRQNYVNNVSDLNAQRGNSRASGIVGVSNAITGGIGTLANMYQQQQAIDALNSQRAGSTADALYSSLPTDFGTPQLQYQPTSDSPF